MIEPAIYPAELMVSDNSEECICPIISFILLFIFVHIDERRIYFNDCIISMSFS